MDLQSFGVLFIDSVFLEIKRKEKEDNEEEQTQ